MDYLNPAISRIIHILAIASLCFVASACGGGGSGSSTPPPAALPPAPSGPIQFHCAKDNSCPEVMIQGDPFATLGAGAAPFRGYGDPSLEYDPDNAVLWLTYSWLDVLTTPPDIVDFGVRTHLARSTDQGATFSFERVVNDTQAISHPDSGAPGWLIHEVSSLVKQPDGLWQVLWLQYFDPLGDPPPARGDFQYDRSIDSSPGLLGMNAES